MNDDRFWSSMDRPSPTACWYWRKSVHESGYGNVMRDKRRQYAHRYAWEQTHGKVPHGLCVLHHCDNRRCCNPSHLFLGTRAANSKDMTQKCRSRHGESHYSAKLSKKDVEQIIRSDLTSQALASLYPVSARHIRKVRARTSRVREFAHEQA